MIRDFFKLNEEEKEFLDSINTVFQEFWTDLKPIRRIVLIPFVILLLAFFFLLSCLIIFLPQLPSSI